MAARAATRSGLIALGIVLVGCGSSTPTPTAVAKLTPRQVFEAAAPGTVQLIGKAGDDTIGGTGIIFDVARRLVVTNAHVVDGLSALKVRLGDQPAVAARILGVAPCDDVAVVQYNEVLSGARALPLGDNKTVRNEDEVVALGYPASFAPGLAEKVVSTNGTVQSPDVAAEPDPSMPKYASTIQHSATINHGNSGGPLLDTQGKVVGINTLANFGSESQQVQGQFYAISIDRVKPLLPDLASGHSQADVGWNLVPLAEISLPDLFTATGFGSADEGQQAARILKEARVDGMVVLGVDPGSASEKAKIVPGDLVQTINGTSVTDQASVCDILETAKAGATLDLGGRYLTDAEGQESFGKAWETQMVFK